jgi:hypothetical protein
MPVLSLRAYAKHRGVSLAAVQKAIRSGRMHHMTGRSTAIARMLNGRRRRGRQRRRSRRRRWWRTEVPRRPRAGLITSAPGRPENHSVRLAKIEFEEKTPLISRTRRRWRP